MAEVKNMTVEGEIGEDEGDEKEVRLTSSAPDGGVGNQLGQKGGDFERRKKTRRRKAKRKNPYAKATAESRKVPKRAEKLNQPEAPYNSNRFLIEDHNDLQDFDVKLLAPHRPRVRDSSFTSVDSDQDYFYSSPEDEEEFLTKEFSNTYQILHAESLNQMTKEDLVSAILQLEDKVEKLEKKLTRQEKPAQFDQMLKFQQEISKLALVNEELTLENERLRRENLSRLSPSSMDSESDSSTSCSSQSSEPGKEPILMNGHTETETPDDPR